MNFKDVDVKTLVEAEKGHKEESDLIVKNYRLCDTWNFTLAVNVAFA